METSKITGMNKKMKGIVESKKVGLEKKNQITVNHLQNLLFPNFVLVHDCIIISKKPLQQLEKHFDSSLKLYSEKTAYEASNTEIRINDFFDNQISAADAISIAFLVIDCWVPRLKSLGKGCKICFIFSCDEEFVTLRFHRIRSTEKMWLADNLEDYEEPVGYVET